MDLLRKQTLFSICRCRCTQILKTVKSQNLHSIKSSKIVFLELKCLKRRISFFLIHFTRSAERKVVPPRVRGPLPPLPLCNFLCSTATSTVTFHPNTFTCRTSVWNRGSWNLPLSTPSSCLPQSIPDYRHYYA